MLIKSYAKINPILKVGKKRLDGFHNLFLLYQTISLYDEVEIFAKFSKSNSISIKCTNKLIPTGSSNLVYKATELILNEASISAEVTIFIKKNIPVGGGLGGGSSNAAAVIKGLNDIFDLRFSKSKMMNLASQIGSDVPFFLEGGIAAGFGRGEIIVPMKSMKKMKLLAVFPKKFFSTGKMYNLLDEKSIVQGDDIFFQISDFYDYPYDLMENDFDKVVQYMDSDVFMIMEKIRNLGFKVILSGSGSTFLIFLNDKLNFKDAISLLPKKYNFKKVTTGVWKD